MDVDIQFKISYLNSLRSPLHWFCPKLDDADNVQVGDYDDFTPCVRPGQRVHGSVEVKFDHAKERQAAFRAALLVYSFGEGPADILKDQLTQGIRRQLERCDQCLFIFHRIKQKLLHDMLSQHAEEEVAQFGQILDSLDLERVQENLHKVQKSLERLPSEQRSLSELSPSSLLAILEALVCEASASSPEFLSSCFDIPWRLCQTNTPFKLDQHTPALGYFLFSDKETRSDWALATLRSSKLPQIKPAAFEWAFRRAVGKALTEVVEGRWTDAEYQFRFWQGIDALSSKITEDALVHHLLGLDSNIFSIGLQLVHASSPFVIEILKCFKKLISISPDGFWNAAQTFSPHSIVENVFRGPAVISYLENLQPDEVGFRDSPVRAVTGWLQPFLSSLKPANHPQACRAIVQSLLDNFQNEKFSKHVRSFLLCEGLTLLGETLSAVQSAAADSGSSGSSVVVIHAMDIVLSRKELIFDLACAPQDDDESAAITQAALTVLRKAYVLDTKRLVNDQKVLQSSPASKHTNTAFTETLWTYSLERFQGGQMVLLPALLKGYTHAAGLDEVVKSRDDTDSAYLMQLEQHNKTLRQYSQIQADIYLEISELGAPDIRGLYEDIQTAAPLVAALFCSIGPVFQAAVQVMKNATSEASRPEAFCQLFHIDYKTTMKSINIALLIARRQGNHVAFSRLFKTSSDILDALFNVNYGYLSQETLSSDDKAYMSQLWKSEWQSLETAFEKVLGWDTRVSKDELKELARDTIQFADKLFDHHYQVTSALEEESSEDSDEAALHKELATVTLEQPNLAMDKMIGWLRLNDDYLLTTMIGLVKKIFGQLAELGMSIHDATLEFVEQIAIFDARRSNLSPQQKAELAQALGKFHGYKEPAPRRASDSASTSRSQTPSFNQRPLSKQTKQKKIDVASWAGKASESKAEPSIDDVYGDLDDDDLAQAVIDLTKAEAPKKKIPLVPARSSIAPSFQAPGKKSVREKAIEKQNRKLVDDKAKAKQSTDFREKRKREEEEKRARDRALAARIKGASTSLNAGAGSALATLTGVPGKDHAPKTSSLLVDSESDDSDSSDDDAVERIIERSKKSSFAKKSSTVQEIEESKRNAMKMVQQLPTKKTKQSASKHDIRARLMPDLRPLHDGILSWNYFHDGDFPPNSTKKDFTLVTNKFQDPEQYSKTFSQLHLLEAWQGMLKAKEEFTTKPYELKIVSRATVDTFIELGTAMAPNDSKDIMLGESDIVIISKAKSPTREADEPHCLARISRIKRNKGTMEISYQLRHNGPLQGSLNPGIVLHAQKVTSIVPLEREYGALIGLKYYDLRDEICNGEPSPLLPYSQRNLEQVFKVYDVNLGQAKAIKSAIDNDCFTLIQGPPGSGKTKTIVAIVGAILTESLVDKAVTIARPNLTNSYEPRPTPKKLLVCAPSNAAVDELVMRFKRGIKTMKNQTKQVSVVRLGRSDAVNREVLDVTLDQLVDRKLGIGKKENTGDEIAKYINQHKAKTNIINSLRDTLDKLRQEGHSSQDLEKQMASEQRDRKALSEKLDRLRDASSTMIRDHEINRRQIQQNILENADVICATLSGSGHDMFQNLSIEFETVIIDEAAQSVELSALIPLKYGCVKCILVGDPKQLPPTVLSREAARLQYEQSLFVRMQSNFPDRIHLLDTQYRMHPDISQYPSQAFYDKRLVDGPDLAKLRSKPWHVADLLGPYRFFDVEGSQQSASGSGHSVMNIAEINVAIQLYGRLIKDFPKADVKNQVGIITPYKAQLHELRRRFRSHFGDEICDGIEFNSTDAFQGRESEIIIFSCVRASSKGIGFVGDIRRMNVGLTRAKSSLWILGNSKSLSQNEYWGGLISDAKARSSYTDGNVMAKLKQPSSRGNSGKMTAAQHMANSPTANKQDLEMQDAPQGFDTPAQKSHQPSKTTAKNDTVDVDMADAPDNPKPVWQAGGRNGLNPNAACQICGTLEHITSCCDNEEAKQLNGRRCGRCGSLDHPVRACHAKLCIRCGQFDHEKDNCDSKQALSRYDQNRLQGRERNRNYGAQRAAEKRLEEREPRVPTLKITSDLPPNPIANDNKRSATTTAATPTAGENGWKKEGDKKAVAGQSRKRNDSPTLDHDTKRSRHGTPADETGARRHGNDGVRDTLDGEGNAAPPGSAPNGPRGGGGKPGAGKVIRRKPNNDPFANARRRGRN